MRDIDNLNVTDGFISDFIVRPDEVELTISDWKEEIHHLIFRKVIGVEVYSPLNVDLSHLRVLEKSEKLENVCSIVEEEIGIFREYSFISAWNEQSVFTIFGELVCIRNKG